jgi:hypothetical protein
VAVELIHRVKKTWRFHTAGARPFDQWWPEQASINGWALAFTFRDVVEELWPGWCGDVREQHLMVAGMATCFEVDPFVTPSRVDTILREAKAKGLDPSQANVAHHCIHGVDN